MHSKEQATHHSMNSVDYKIRKTRIPQVDPWKKVLIFAEYSKQCVVGVR